jgi:hypothetical protein
MSNLSVCEQILDLARWAPSGDNTQPWRFEIKGEREIVIHGFDTRDHCVYDLDGHPSQMALGALLETLRIAASAHGLLADVTRRSGLPDETPTFDVRLVSDPLVVPSPLIACITGRAVQRRPMSTRPLTAEQKAKLEASVAPDFTIDWFETLPERWRIAKLLFRNAKLRLILPEAFAVHRSVIEWNAQYSEDKIPGQAVGVDPLTANLMRWVMQSWPRVEFFNTWLGGTIMPRLQLDLVPGLMCGAHIGLVAKVAPTTVGHYISAGGALQRLWLEVARQGNWLQPEMTPVIFGRYHRENRQFTQHGGAKALSATIASEFTKIFGIEREGRVVFMARIGAGPAPKSRSIRKPLSQLLLNNTNKSNS